MQIVPFYDYGFGMGVDPFNYSCCGSTSQGQWQAGAPQYYRGTPYYKQIIATTG